MSITLVFGDCKINSMNLPKPLGASNIRYSVNNIRKMYRKFKKDENIESVQLLEMTPYEDDCEANVLIFRNFTSYINLDKTQLSNELNGLQWNTKYFDQRRKKVLNRQGRYQLNFSNNFKRLIPDYNNKLPIVYNIQELTYMNFIYKNILDKFVVCENIHKTFDSKMIVKANLYRKNGGINFHGDRERNYTISLRLGESFVVGFMWFKKKEPVSPLYVLHLKPGDLYIMSDIAGGHDNYLRANKNIQMVHCAADSIDFIKKKYLKGIKSKIIEL